MTSSAEWLLGKRRAGHALAVADGGAEIRTGICTGICAGRCTGNRAGNRAGIRTSTRTRTAAINPLIPVPGCGRFDYTPIHRRPDFSWPGGVRLAVYIGFNIEHFAFGEGLGACIAPASPPPDVLNHSWREYGNRVGAWRCLDLFDDLCLPTGALINTALYDHRPELVAACVARGDELIGHGHTHSQRQAALDEPAERALLAACRSRINAESGTAPAGWLSPWISESFTTPDLLAETGYAYTLNWCHDDPPMLLRTRGGQPLWSVPYPQEINDIPAVIARQMDGRAFGAMISDHFGEMRQQTRRPPLVMGIALHPYIVGQPHRLRPLRGRWRASPVPATTAMSGSPRRGRSAALRRSPAG